MAGRMAITLGMVSVFVMGLTCAGAEKQPRGPALGVSISTDRGTYQAGEAISMTLCAFNWTVEVVALHFASAKRYDFTIVDEEGREVWRWSNGRMFAQVFGKESLGPGKEQCSYTAKYDGTLSPGMYKITGFLVAKNRPMSASLTVEVR